MIEITVDHRAVEKALKRLGASQYKLDKAVKEALRIVTPQVRAEVIGTLEKDVAVGRVFIRRAVKAARYANDHSEFRIFSKRLFLDDYALTPREQTARKGMPSSQWPGFSYKLRTNGKNYHSSGTPTGSDGSGSKPFIARTAQGNLRVMYRRNAGRVQAGEDRVYLAYAPSIQYHAANPAVEDKARETSMRLFSAALSRVVDHQLGSFS